MKIRQKKFFKIIFHFALAAQLAFFQCGLPVLVAKAETVPNEQVEQASPEQEEEPAVEESIEEEAIETEKLADTSVPDEKKGAAEEETAAEAEESPEEFWKTCQLDDLFDDFQDESECGECKKMTTCGEIEICLTEKIEIENDADINNDIETAANTGQNETDLKEPGPVRDVPLFDASDLSLVQEEAGSDAASTVLPEAAPEEQLTPDEAATPENDRDDREDNSSRREKDENIEEEALSEDALAEISTGDAVAATNVVNEVNTNVVGDNGIETVENIYGNVEGDINLLETFNSLLENAENTNNSNLSAFDAVEISIENEADIDNDVVTEASSGQNEISNETENGDSLITTGDAIAVANVANIVNNNIVGNNFLFAVINIFGNWIGDLIVPGEGLLSVPASGQPDNFIVDVENDTDIENNVQTSATTGLNEIETEGGSSAIDTGSAYSENGVINQVGSTVVGSNWFFLAINNMGNWVGNVLNWNSEKNGYETVFSFDFEEDENSEDGGLASWLTKIFIRNEADVENNVTTTANTGGNEIESEGGGANITTGNAYAFSKIYNLVNNNFIGSNWMFAVVNIFGSWQGDVEFAYPDLSVSLADNVSKVKKGDSYAYKITYKNDGRADCENLNAGLHLPDGVDFQSDSSGTGPWREGNDLSWTLEGLKAGEEGSFFVNVVVSDDLPESTAFLESEAAVATGTKEVELANNVAADQTEVWSLAKSGANQENSQNVESGQTGSEFGESETSRINSALFITRSSSKKKMEVGQIAKHTIIVTNTGNSTISDIVVSDKIMNKNGGAGDYSWKVEKLEAGKKAIVTYKLMVNLGAPTGDYRNTAVASGFDETGSEVWGNEAKILVDVNGRKNQEENYYYYYYTSADNPPVSLVGAGETAFVETAEAAEALAGDGKVLGAWTNGICRTLPWWGWAAAAFLYFAAVHWALLRQKEIIRR